MSVQVEKLEKNMAKLTVEVSAEDFKAAIKKAFNKNKNRFAIPGFRKGKAPQAMIEKMYGEGVFYEDAADEAINASYAEAMKESGLDIVSRPEVTIEKIGKDEPFVYSALVAVKPEVTLGQYKGVEVEKADASVSAEDVEAELKKVQEQNARLLTVEDRGVEDGDQTVIDFEGFVDGKGFEGGKAEDYPLTIGSHSFIDTFEEQLIGKKIGEECTKYGIEMLDAPVSGGEPKAIDGTLSVMVGGKKDLFDKYYDMLMVMAGSVVYVGDLGSGNVAKLANQMIVAINIAAVSEALTFAKKAGTDPELVYQAIRGGLAGSTVMDAKAPMMLAGNYKPGFRIELHIKDLNNALNAAHAISSPAPLTAQLMEVMQFLRSEGCDKEDHSSIIKYYEKIAGASVVKDKE